MESTHEVFNQPVPLADVNLFASNRPLRDALRFNAASLATGELERLGAALGSAEMLSHARLANVHTPQLHTHDRVGRRVDTVEFHPSYHALMALATGAGLHGTPWAGGEHAHLRRAAGFMLFTETESSTLCPISMTYAVAPALQGNPAVAAEWGPKLANRAYDPRFVPASQKAGLTMVFCGAESGSDAVLAKMNKGTTTDQIAHTAAKCREHGIIPEFSFVFGDPDEPAR